MIYDRIKLRYLKLFKKNKTRSIQELTLFLDENRNTNFASYTPKKIYEQLEANGLTRLFLECKNRMWKVNKKTPPFGWYYSFVN